MEDVFFGYARDLKLIVDGCRGRWSDVLRLLFCLWEEEDEEMGAIDVFIDSGMHETVGFRKFNSEIYLQFCHFLLFQLAREIYKACSPYNRTCPFTLINFNVMLNKLESKLNDEFLFEFLQTGVICLFCHSLKIFSSREG